MQPTEHPGLEGIERLRQIQPLHQAAVVIVANGEKHRHAAAAFSLAVKRASQGACRSGGLDPRQH
jgi:hypothetical protein